jgi:hypothetical protein
VTGNNECYSQWADDVPNASTNLSSQVSRARWTTVLGALFFESALFTVPLRSHLNGLLHIYDPDTFRIVRLTSTRLHSANPQRRPQSSSFWLVGYTEVGMPCWR